MNEHDGESDARERSRDITNHSIQRAVAVVLVVAAAFVTLPGVYRPLGPVGIDPGWQWAANQADKAGLVFGRDVVFTYGPLAFLMAPLDVGRNLVIANLLYLLVQALFAAALVLLIHKHGKAIPAGVFALLYICAHNQGLSIEAQFLISVGMLAFLSAIEGNRLLISAAAALTGVLLLVKMSLGIAALVILIAAVMVAKFVFGRPATFALGLLPFPLVFALLAAIYFDGPGSMIRWWTLSMEVVSGYSVANSIVGPVSQVVFGAVVTAGWFAVTPFLRSDRAQFAFYLVFAPIVLIQFRLAFVRQDSHQLQFVPFILALVALSTLLTRRRRQLVAHVSIFLLLLIGGALTHLVDPVGRGLLPADVLAGAGGAKAISKLVHLEETQQTLATESSANLAPLKLTDEWLNLVRSSRNGVGTLPWEIQYCPANGLDWNPTPTLQLYSAYTRKLDLWSAEKYKGAQRPDFIINEYVPVGKRHQMIDAPATWREIFIRYRMNAAILGPTQVALLEKRQEIPEISYEVVGTDSLVLGTSGIDVPSSDGLLFAEFDLRLNTLGRVQKTIFRVPLIYLVMYRVSGDQTHYRLTPDPAVNGVLINRFPKDFMGYRRLWQGVIDDPVVRIVIAGPGLSFFRSPVEITWRELKIESPTPQSPSDLE